MTHKAGYRHVRFAGATGPSGDDVAAQVRFVLDRRRRVLEDLGGSLDDVVMSRYFVNEDHLSRETQARVHEVRDERVDRPNVPAGTVIGVGALLVEVELEAEIPDVRWETEVLAEGDRLD